LGVECGQDARRGCRAPKAVPAGGPEDVGRRDVPGLVFISNDLRWEGEGCTPKFQSGVLPCKFL
jgi:hypothetical protein